MSKLLRTAAYCRVSTEKEDQRSSMEAQTAFFQQYCRERPGWTLVELFADTGLSGTSTRRRPQFNRMLALAEGGGLDLIVTKEVSRFARNTVDALNVTRRLKARGVGVLFLNDGIDTRESDGEFRLTIMASVAQEESRRISQRTRWGQAQAMKRGVVFGNDSIYGYTLRGGELTPRQEQAEVVRMIYAKFLQEGKGAYVIARELTEQGVSPPLRAEGPWSPATVLRILRNEKYCGSLLQQKYRTTDYLSHRKLPNDGTEPQYFFENHHEAIVSPEEFRRAQEELARRRGMAGEGKRFSTRYWYSGRVICGACGKTMTVKRTRRAGGREYACFVCRGRAAPRTEDRCDMRGISGAALEVCARHVVQALGLDREAVIEEVLSAARKGRGASSSEEALGQARARQKARRERGLAAYLDGTISREEWASIAARCGEALQRLEASAAQREGGLTEEQAGRLRAQLEAQLDGGPWVLGEVFRQVTVERDHLLFFLRECPAAVLVRAEGAGSGRGYRVTVTECRLLPMAQGSYGDGKRIPPSQKNDTVNG